MTFDKRKIKELGENLSWCYFVTTSTTRTATEWNSGFHSESLVVICLRYRVVLLISSLLQMSQLVLSSLDMWFCSGHGQWYIFKQQFVPLSINCMEMRQISVLLCVFLIRDRMFPTHSVSENCILTLFFYLSLPLAFWKSAIYFVMFCMSLYSFKLMWDNILNYRCMCCVWLHIPEHCCVAVSTWGLYVGGLRFES
jgi:hypothetical protein